MVGFTAPDAHQGFSGNIHEINRVEDLQGRDASLDQRFFSKIANFFVSSAFPLGHGATSSHPDRPYISCKYVNGLGQTVERNNQSIGQPEAVDEEGDEEGDGLVYSASFLTSDWKLSHDALQAHWVDILHDVLPAMIDWNEY